MSKTKAASGHLTAFELFHPIVAAIYFAAALLLCMLAFHPVLVGIALVSGFVCRMSLSGWRPACASLRWQIPLLLIVAVLNPLFSTQGSTELFHIGSLVVRVESIAYGLCMGALLMSATLWFSNAAQVLTSDKTMALLGNILPTIALMTSMATRMVPQFVRRTAEINTVSEACTIARPHGARERITFRLRELSVLMGWSMEESLETADAMRSRGWGAGHRTTYRRYRFRAFDGIALVFVVAFACLCALLAQLACSQFSFYPQLDSLSMWWGYPVYALFMCLPLIMWAIERIRWSR